MIKITHLILLFLGLFIAIYFDLKERRIPNWLCIAITSIGLIYSFIHKGILGLGEHVLAFIVGFIIYFLFYLLGAFSAGDVKLIASIGALMGLKFTIFASFWILLIGGIISFFILLFNQGIHYIKQLFMRFIQTLWLRNFRSIIDKSFIVKQHSYPFTIAISAGSLVTIWYAGLIP